MIGGAGPFDSFVLSPSTPFVLSPSKDELAQDMLQPCDPIQRCRIATLKGCATEEGCPVPSSQFLVPGSQPPVPSSQSRSSVPSVLLQQREPLAPSA